MKVTRKISQRIFIRILTGASVIILAASLVNFYYTRKILVRLTASTVGQTFESVYNKLESRAIPLLNQAEHACRIIEITGKDSAAVIEVLREGHARFPEILVSRLVLEGDNEFRLSLSMSKKSSASEDPSELLINSFFPEPGLFEPGPENIRIGISGDTITLKHWRTGESRVWLSYDLPIDSFTLLFSDYAPELESRHYLFDEKGQAIRSSSEDGRQDPRGANIRLSETRAIRKFIEQKKYGFFYYPQYNKGEALYLARLEGTPLIMASVIEIGSVSRKLRHINLIIFGISLTALLGLLITQRRIIFRLTKPLEELIRIADKLRNGSLHTSIPENYSDKESAELAATLRILQDKMQRYVSNLNTTLKQKRAMTHELSLAEKIQLDMLPNLRHALTDIPQIDIYSMIKPARGIAGDFFDYSFVGADHFFFIIGDVSGKGIPAALFMVKTLILFRSEIKRDPSPGRLFSAVSDLLIRNNEEGMFVTAIGGILNFRTGELELCDAGHNTPFRCLPGAGFEMYSLNKNVPLGIVGGMEYKTTRTTMAKGDTLFLYTDGLPEAVNANDEMYEYSGIQHALKGQANLSLEKIFEHVQSRLNSFVGKAVQSDDITMILLRFEGEGTAIGEGFQ